MASGNAGANALDGIKIPTSFVGKFAEVAVFDRVLSDAEIAQMEAYLNDKWGIQPVPLQVGATAWFDASDPYTIIETSGSVSEWRDKSGNGYDLTQGTGTAQPTTGTRTLNGLNVLDFDGSSDYLQGAFGGTLSQPNTIFAVFQNDAASPADYIYDGDDGTNRHAFYLSSNKYNLFAGGNPNGGTIDTDPHISKAVFNGAGSSLFIDGSSVFTGSVGTQSMDGITVGARYNGANFLDGAIAELIVVDGTLTADEISRVENYLANKWGITL